jgi:hypothetical protein
MSKGDDNFVHYAITAYSGRYVYHLHIGRKKLTDKVISIKRTNTFSTHASNLGWDVDKVRILGHRSHCRLEISG